MNSSSLSGTGAFNAQNTTQRAGDQSTYYPQGTRANPFMANQQPNQSYLSNYPAQPPNGKSDNRSNNQA